MELDDLIVSVYCLLDDEFKDWLSGESLRERGFGTSLPDTEVLTIEAVGEYLGFSQDKGIFDYFQRHYAQFFPALGRVHRTSFVRQAANLFKVKECLWQRLLARTSHERRALRWWILFLLRRVCSLAPPGVGVFAERLRLAGIPCSGRPSTVSGCM